MIEMQPRCHVLTYDKTEGEEPMSGGPESTTAFQEVPLCAFRECLERSTQGCVACGGTFCQAHIQKRVNSANTLENVCLTCAGQAKAGEELPTKELTAFLGKKPYQGPSAPAWEYCHVMQISYDVTITILQIGAYRKFRIGPPPRSGSIPAMSYEALSDQVLAHLGQQGWEMVSYKFGSSSMSGSRGEQWYFKRPRLVQIPEEQPG